jgi:hypothetical protein
MLYGVLPAFVAAVPMRGTACRARVRASVLVARYARVREGMQFTGARHPQLCLGCARPIRYF